MCTLSQQEIIPIDENDPFILKADKKSAELYAKKCEQETQQLLEKEKQYQLTINKLNHKIHEMECKYNEQLKINQQLNQKLQSQSQSQDQQQSRKRKRNYNTQLQTTQITENTIDNYSICSVCQTAFETPSQTQRQTQETSSFPICDPPKKRQKLNQRWQSGNVESNDRDEWKLNPIKLREGIQAICKELGNDSNDMINSMMPTIDCFSNYENKQECCYEQITKDDDYFSDKYDNISFWCDKIAWCNPPFIREMLIDCVDSFEEREMKGYICGPYYKPNDPKFKEQQWYMNASKKWIVRVNIGGRNDENFYFSGWNKYKSGGSPTPFETVICYFDYQN